MTQLQLDESFMRLAIAQASFATKEGDIPVGAVIVRDGEVIATGFNIRERDKLATGHAEIVAIEEACRKLNSWRLSGCTLYVTMEPCPMCAGAIISARLDRVVFGVFDDKAGCFGGVMDLSKADFNHSPRLRAGILEGECREQIASFFDQLRQK